MRVLCTLPQPDAAARGSPGSTSCAIPSLSATRSASSVSATGQHPGRTAKRRVVRATDALAPIAGVSDVALDGRVLRARARHGAAAIPEVMLALESHGIRALSVTLARPSLDDVYLRYAGRTFHRAETTPEEVAA